jgi:hypothetical protein
MDPNEHSPIARCLERMQSKWQAAVTTNPDYRLACWRIAPDEAALLNGFCKLESSRHGGLPEIFVVMLTPFENYATFSLRLLSDLLDAWEGDAQAGPPAELGSTLAYWRAQLAADAPAEALLVELLTTVYQYCGSPRQPLVLGLLPRQVSNFADYNRWLVAVATALPVGVKLMVVDHLGQDYLQPACDRLKGNSLRIDCGDLGVAEALQGLATGGDPQQPDVVFRQCLFGMGTAAAAKNRAQLESWGEKALLAAQRSGQLTLMATARAVYAGFLMHFRAGDRIRALLNEGIGLAQTAVAAGEAAGVPVLGQLYGYQSAWHSMGAEWGQAAQWMSKQARLALAHEQWLPAVTACRMAASLYQKNGNDVPFREYTALGYQAGLELDEASLLSSEYGLLARDYHQHLLRQERTAEAREVDQRLQSLYGAGWQQALKAEGKGRIALTPVV